MNRPPLHLARPGQLPAPVTGDDSLDILSQAIESLAQLRTTYWLGDSAVHLHALASLIAQAEQLLPRAVHDARDQELTCTLNRPGINGDSEPTDGWSHASTEEVSG